MDCSPPGSSVRRIIPTRILDRVAISSSRGSSQRRDQTVLLCVSCMGSRFFTTESPWKPPEISQFQNVCWLSCWQSLPGRYWAQSPSHSHLPGLWWQVIREAPSQSSHFPLIPSHQIPQPWPGLGTALWGPSLFLVLLCQVLNLERKKKRGEGSKPSSLVPTSSSGILLLSHFSHV